LRPLDHGRLASAADGQVADGNHLHAERRIAQNTDVIQEPAGFDGGLENFGARVQQPAHQFGALAAPLLDHDFYEESL